jgi:hypothetical protein
MMHASNSFGDGALYGYQLILRHPLETGPDLREKEGIDVRAGL